MNIFCCASCAKQSEQAGSGMRLVRGSRSRVCDRCKQAIDKARAEPKTKPEISLSEQRRRSTEEKILTEASKPKGVSFHELRDRRDLPTSVSREHCRRMASEGRLHCLRMNHGHGLRWFANKSDAKAFGEIQARLKAKPRGVADLPAPKVEFDHQRVDLRYQIDPETFLGGEFCTLGVGRYLEAA